MLDPALSSLIAALDLAAVAVFAVTGALVASRKQLDIVGFMWLAVVTGIGGGTVRDLLLDVPVGWVRDPTNLLACLVPAVVIYFTAHLVQSRYRLLVWLDAIGLALVAVVGAAKALDAGAGPVAAVAMGVITATVGGILRDVIGHEPSIVLQREIYVTAALAGAVAYVACLGATGDRTLATCVGFILGFGIRGLAIGFSWSLPTYRSRAGRSQAGKPQQEP